MLGWQHTGTSLAMQGNVGMGYEYERNGPPEYGGPGGYPVPGVPAGPGALTGAPIGYGGYTGYEGYGEYDDGYGYDGYADGSHPAVKWGLIFGIVMAASILVPFVVLIVEYPLAASNPFFAMLSLFMQHPDAAAELVFMLLIASGITTLISLFFAGFLTTRETGTVRSGMVAGVLADLAANGVVVLIVLMLVLLEGPRTEGTTSVGGQIAVAIGGLMQQCCCLISLVVSSAAIAALGAGLARLIWGPAEE